METCTNNNELIARITEEAANWRTVDIRQRQFEADLLNQVCAACLTSEQLTGLADSFHCPNSEGLIPCLGMPLKQRILHCGQKFTNYKEACLCLRDEQLPASRHTARKEPVDNEARHLYETKKGDLGSYGKNLFELLNDRFIVSGARMPQVPERLKTVLFGIIDQGMDYFTQGRLCDEKWPCQGQCVNCIDGLMLGSCIARSDFFYFDSPRTYLVPTVITNEYSRAASDPQSRLNAMRQVYLSAIANN